MEVANVALDIEGVLSDTHEATAQRSNFLTEDECPPDDFSFPTDEHFEEFMHVSSNLWHNHNHMIPPKVENIWKAVRNINHVYSVDIVTNRNNVDDMLREWLDGYNVEYDNFYSLRGDKTGIGDHDIHVDDSPHVAADALSAGRHVVLIDAPYNQSVEFESSEEDSQSANTTSSHKPHRRLERVADIHEAADLLCSMEYRNSLPTV